MCEKERKYCTYQKEQVVFSTYGGEFPVPLCERSFSIKTNNNYCDATCIDSANVFAVISVLLERDAGELEIKEALRKAGAQDYTSEQEHNDTEDDSDGVSISIDFERDDPVQIAVDDSGEVHGIWIRSKHLAQELENERDNDNDTLKPKMRSCIASLKASDEYDLPSDIYTALYSAMVCGDYRVDRLEHEELPNGEGFFFVLNDESDSVYASVRKGEQKKWWQFWKRNP